MTLLKSIAEIRMGATLRGRDATRSVPGGSYELIRIGDISQDGTFRNEEFVRIEPNESVNKDLWLRTGDVLFPGRGTRTTALAISFDRPRIIAGPQFFLIRPDRQLVLPEYLAWYLRSPEISSYFDSRRKGTHVQIIERNDLTQLPIPLPPIAVQQRIVEFDALSIQERDITERLAKLRRQLASGLLARVVKTDALPNQPQQQRRRVLDMESKAPVSITPCVKRRRAIEM